MTLALSSPSEIYKRISDELEHIIKSLNLRSNGGFLEEAQENALKVLAHYQSELKEQLAKLEKNSEWNIFTIAFYGETGAGKSTIIETLRILLKEPTKLASQQVFRDLQTKYGLSEKCLQLMYQAIEKVDVQISDLALQSSIVTQEYEKQYNSVLDNIRRIKRVIVERKCSATLWQKILYLFRKIPEEEELESAELQLAEIAMSRDNAVTQLQEKKAELENHKLALEQQLDESMSHMEALTAAADGTIIGDGRSDFTRKTHRYDFKLKDQEFALLDVPGIEGKEGLVLQEIEQAVEKAHAIFYVTNQAAPPQTGDERRKGTLEKIKAHLGAQAEVWTIFNKKITSPKHALKTMPLIKDDEKASLKVLDETMRQHLGDHYRGVFSLTALSAFLASTDHFAPMSQYAKRRNKVLQDFTEIELLEKSRMLAFVKLLSDEILVDSKAKIKRANFNQAKKKVDEINAKLKDIKQTFVELAEQLQRNGNSSKTQLLKSFDALKQRVDSCSGALIDEFSSNVRKSIYKVIDDNISNDIFKRKLHEFIERELEEFNENIPPALEAEIKIFQNDAEDILQRFQEHSHELASTYGKLGNLNINYDFDLKIKIDNGINTLGLLFGLIGLVLAPFTGGNSLWLTGSSLLTSVASVGKSLFAAFSPKYKKSQQRKAADDNLSMITEEIRKSLMSALDEAFSEMKGSIDKLEQVLATPGLQAAAQARLLDQSTQKLDLLSLQIGSEGNLS